VKEFEMKRFHFVYRFAVALCLLLVAIGGCNQGRAGEMFPPPIGIAGLNVPYVPTPQHVVEAMLDMAQVTSSDYVIDLGSGDGRIVIAAAKRGARAHGIEYNPDLVEFSRRAAAQEGVSAKATFEKADIFESDFSQATVLTLFLGQCLNLDIRPKILDLKPGTRVVSYKFDMGDWKPDQSSIFADSFSSWSAVHLWIVPAKVNGIWKFDDSQISFTQKFQYINGTLTTMGKDMELSGKLDGERVSFTAGGREYTGTVSDNMTSGTHDGGGSWKAVR